MISTSKKVMIALIVFQAVLLFIFRAGLKQGIMTAVIILIGEAACMVYLFEQFESVAKEQSSGVKKVLGDAAREAFVSGGVGMVIYNEDYEITWVSDLFADYADRVGTKILTWVPEADDIISGSSDSVTAKVDGRYYELHRKAEAPIIIFNDITDLNEYRKKYAEEHIVIGMASFDNYEESTAFADEADIAGINTAVRTQVSDYCIAHGIFYRRLSRNQYMMILNEKIYDELVRDRFSVLEKVRKAAQKVDVSITLSMAFARGTSDLQELDEMVTKLMDLAQTRGGDQVAVQKVSEEVKYFGGSTEAAEKRSRVRVRVISHALRDLIQKSSNVIICGHKTADFDCIGSAICISRMASALHKQAVIIAKTGGIEEKLGDAMRANEAQLKEEVTFVSESEAVNQLHPNTLVIMTDHHNIRQSNGAKVLEAANKIVIIDHHRRSTDIGVKPVLVYIEAGASSTCELLTEMIPYISSQTDISALAATFMLAGMIVDTQKWRVRTGARTYEAASALRKLGADPQKAYDYLKDTFDEFSLKSKAVSASEVYRKGIVICCVKDIMTRSLMSQIADSLLSIQGIRAAFVIANSSELETGISARSNGSVNVQVIMEQMKGGGHMTAAAMQRQKTTPEAVRKELTEVLDNYFKEVSDESNT
ncbi:MAG: DHH family phosphoesterase [Solobacterium sp.]|nr:DHH family phosphoesterase [Solobacterium sp.]